MRRRTRVFAQPLRFKPESVEYLVNVGLNMARQNNPGGIEFLERALQLDPTHFEAHHVLAEILPSIGFYERGFQEYEWRWRSPELSKSVRPFLSRCGMGSRSMARSSSLHAEQGFGDTIQFVRFIPDAVRLGGVVLLEVQPGSFIVFLHILMESRAVCNKGSMRCHPSMALPAHVSPVSPGNNDRFDSLSRVVDCAVRNDTSNDDGTLSFR